MDRTYTVVLLREEGGGYSVVVPALPGCFMQGSTVPEALERAKGAIRCHLEAMQADGDPIPPDVTRVTFDWEDATEAVVYKVTVQEAAPVA